MKNIIKFKKNNEIEETKEEVQMKPVWSLKKKLLVGGGVLALVAGGIVTLVNKGKNAANDQVDDEDEIDEDFDDEEESNEVVIED